MLPPSLKLMKVEKTTRPFRYDLNQILYNYTGEVTNRFKGLALINRMHEELWMVIYNIVQEVVIKTISKKKKCKKAKWLSELLQVVTYGCESQTIKKAECRRIDAFELRCWRRLLRAPWTVGRSNQSILKEISPEYSSEGLMLKLKLRYFGHLMRRTASLEKTLMLGKIEGRRRRG